ncbi:MAG: NifU family protein [candidate division NC10 bacterium]|nr:NifU family protein [candidate division NC10 bacterium]
MVQTKGGSALAERVEAALAEIRPVLNSDGGDIELLEVVGSSARVRLAGSFMSCPSSMMTLQYGVERMLKERIPEFGELIVELF